jgi:hypothetical protein
VQAKVDVIDQFPVPLDKKSLMRFIGMIGFYRRFCENLSQVIAPLTNLLSKKVKFDWNDKCQVSFENAKNLLVTAPVLAIADHDKQFILCVDASDIGCGSVLSQEVKGAIHPVSYFSKKFNPHQRNYSTIEKETLGLILSLEHFEVYLCASKHPILVYTDHNPLTFLQRMQNKNQRLMRWALWVQDFDLDIRHIKGKENIVADALSRAF